jgi:hypothetical protein
MAIGYLNVAIIGRSDGRSAVGAAAYASRTDLVDDRTGTAFRYARKSGDLVTSFVWLPKGAPERLRDRATLWNEVEKAETRKNSQTARRIIMALPHELTAKQQEQLLQDFIKENFTRKGLAVDASIHEPDPNGDDRNDHAHLLIPTRFMDKNGLGKKDRESNDRAALDAWRASWVKLANRQLERYGHAARITFEVAEGQTPQNHLGPEATALERQGIETRAGDDRLEIITDNMQPAANDNVQARAVGKEISYTEQVIGAAQAVPGQQRQPANDNSRQQIIEPETIDRDQQDAAWQQSIDAAGIAYADERRRQFLESQATERAAFDRQGEAMTARHAESWAETLERHAADAVSGYQPGSIEDAGEAVTSGFSFFLGLFTSWAESITRSATGSTKAPPKRQRAPDKTKEKETQRRAEQQREAHSRELEAIMQEQARERESYERHRAQMLFQQTGALQHFEQQVSEKSSLQSAFDRHTEAIDAAREREGQWEPRRIGDKEKGPQRGPDRDGLEL